MTILPVRTAVLLGACLLASAPLHALTLLT